MFSTPRTSLSGEASPTASAADTDLDKENAGAAAGGGLSPKTPAGPALSSNALALSPTSMTKLNSVGKNLGPPQRVPLSVVQSEMDAERHKNKSFLKKASRKVQKGLANMFTACVGQPQPRTHSLRY